MRTTLKRGIGRSLGLDDNDRSALSLAFGPVTRYRQPESPKRSISVAVLRGLGWFSLVLLVLVSGVAGGLYLYARESLNAVAAHSKPVKKAVKELTVPSTSRPAIALMVGYQGAEGTSDTMMLARGDPANHTLSLLSLPRDLYIPIYCHGATVATHDRINSAWGICGGPAGSVDTVQRLTGLKINYLITVNFRAFMEIVNRLRGVYMNVDRRYYIPPHTGISAINLQPGYQKLDGGQALSYVRFRHFDSDLYRTARQQLFIEALRSRLKQTFSIFEIPQLVGALKGNLEIARGGGGALSLSELEAYAGLAYHLPAGHLQRNAIPVQDLHNYRTLAGADVLTAPASAVAGAVHAFLHPDIHQSRQLGIPSSRRSHTTKKTHTIPRKDVSVLVLNAGTTPGEAANTTYLLTRQGYATKTLPSSVPANAPAMQRDTIIYYDPVQPDAKQAAQQLRPLFGSHSRVAQMTTAIAAYAKQATNPKTVVAMGTSFSDKLTNPRQVKPAPHVPPQVSPGLSVTAPSLRGLTSKVHFPIMAPHLIAQYAQLSSLEGVRLFKPVRNQHELVLTFVMPNGIEYWQIEETDWNSAPALQNPTGQFVYHHRKYLLYTTGGTIQMIALRTPKASYWVQNTLLDELSNPTMIAIAESLQPLRP